MSIFIYRVSKLKCTYEGYTKLYPSIYDNVKVYPFVVSKVVLTIILSWSNIDSWQ